MNDPFERLIAVELKLADGGQALRQAYGYLSFADSVYVALPEARCTEELAAEARVLGIGLIAVRRTEAFALVEAPSRRAVAPGRRRRASESVLRSLSVPSLRRAGSPVVAYASAAVQLSR